MEARGENLNSNLERSGVITAQSHQPRVPLEVTVGQVESQPSSVADNICIGEVRERVSTPADSTIAVNGASLAPEPVPRRRTVSVAEGEPTVGEHSVR